MAKWDGTLCAGAVIPSRKWIVAFCLVVLLVAALAAPGFGELIAILNPLLTLVALLIVISEIVRIYQVFTLAVRFLALRGPRPPPIY